MIVQVFVRPFKFAVVSLAITCTAHAGQISAPAHQTETESAAPPSVQKAETSDCDSFYPASGRHADGITVLSVRILPDGTVKEPVIVNSSGDADLDNAAAACLAGAHLAPVTHRGQPVEIVWQRQVVWRNGHHAFIQIPKSSHATQCSGPQFATHGLVLTMYAFRISIDGTVQDIQVTQSSGNSKIDMLGTNCILTSWQYPVALQNGQPIDVDGKAALVW